MPQDQKRRMEKESDGVARTMLRLNNTKYADGSGPKDLTAEARALWRKENGLPAVNSKKYNGKRTQAMDSISGAMRRLVKIKKNMNVTSKAVSIESSELISQGMAAYDRDFKQHFSSGPEGSESSEGSEPPLSGAANSAPRAPASSKGSDLSSSSVSSRLEGSYADHLLGSAYYTEQCVGTNPLDSGKDVNWLFESGTFENSLVEDKTSVPNRDNSSKVERNVYMPLKESQIWEPVQGAKSDLIFKSEISSVTAALKKINSFKGDLKSDFRYISVLLQAMPLTCNENIAEFFHDFLNHRGQHDSNEGQFADTINEIQRAIKGILDESPGFKFHNAVVRPFKTRQYVVNICEISGWFEFEHENKLCRVEVCRKMVVLTMTKKTSSNNPEYIPICEEFFIQASRKDRYTETYHKHGLYVTCKPLPPTMKEALQIRAPRATPEKKIYTQQIQYFGNNAFTVNTLPSSSPPLDKNKDTMKMVGVVVRHLQSVKSVKKSKLRRACEFFKHIKDMNPSDLKNSFLAEQRAYEQTAVVKDKYPAIRIWMSSKSFSVVCISPANYPGFNYVYVHLWQSKIAQESKYDGLSMYPANRTGNEATFPQNTACALKPADSTLPLELELELALL
jgi:hypothetical protein